MSARRKPLRIVTGATPGLMHDAEQLAAALDADWDIDVVSLSARNAHGRWRRLAHTLDPRRAWRAAPVTVFMEGLHAPWMQLAACSVWVPNLEWVDARSAALAGDCVQVWCKTRESERVVAARGLPALYTGFTSRDRHRPAVAKDYRRWLHVAGRSPLKGTATVLATWLRHPEWPPLTVVARPEAHAPVAAPNIVFIDRALGDDELSTLMNSCGVHVCTSEAEGYGHYIAEAMSTAAVTLTTAAAPMDEHLDAACGVLVPAVHLRALRWGQAWQVTPEALADAVHRVLALADHGRAAIGQAARERFLERRRGFHTRINDAAHALPREQGTRP